jgi:hypothetical protein
MNNQQELKENVLRVLLYFDIFNHPLKPEEIFNYLPKNSLTKSDLLNHLISETKNSSSEFVCKNDYYFISSRIDYHKLRLRKEEYSRKHWKIARLVTHIIKRFPFVRAVFVTGSLSKNSSSKISDLDFMLVTEKDRLWIARTLLMLFKKIFLVNKYKYFCINYLITEDNLEIEDKNLYTAIEIVTSKATYNSGLLNKFLSENETWIRNIMPNYKAAESRLHYSGYKVNNKMSFLQKLMEVLIPCQAADKLDNYLMKKTYNHWKNKYPYLTENDRNQMFRTTPKISKVHPQNLQDKILDMYNQKLREFNLM